MLDRWVELFESLQRHALRTALTGMSVAWGIFVLVLLLGAGEGLQNQVEWQFRDDATNSMWLYRGETSRAYQGMPVGRRIRFENDDIGRLKGGVAGIDKITGRYYIRSGMAKYGDQAASFSIRAAHPDHRYLENTIMVSGRYLSDLDIENKRKVAVVGREVVKSLMPRVAEPLGERIDIEGIPYVIVGVFEDVGGVGEERQIYIPITTAQAAYGGGQEVHQIMFTVRDATIEGSEAIATEVRQRLAEVHGFDPEDRKALRVRNNVEQFQEVTQIFAWLNGFIWMVGLGTVLAGVVGVSNIMMVSVRERTAEIGLRKALGATPLSLVRMILEEAIFLTALSGYAGLIAGVGTVSLMAWGLPENDYLRDPDVDLSMCLAALGILIAAGALAGFLPAWRAASVEPIVALRDA